jgi:hypothetical protein
MFLRLQQSSILPHEQAIINRLILKKTLSKKSPHPLFAKEGHKSSLWQREVRRDFKNQYSFYFETV